MTFLYHPHNAEKGEIVRKNNVGKKSNFLISFLEFHETMKCIEMEKIMKDHEELWSNCKIPFFY